MIHLKTFCLGSFCLIITSVASNGLLRQVSGRYPPHASCADHGLSFGSRLMEMGMMLHQFGAETGAVEMKIYLGGSYGFMS